MKSFEFLLPTKVVFGKDALKAFPREVSRLGKKCLWVFGRTSIFRTGLYEELKKLFEKADVEVIEFGGVKSNPLLSKVREGIEVAKKEKVDFILATGGGSVIDTAKAIACGYYHDGDIWEFFEKKVYPKKALPIGVVLTISGTGSELNSISVIVNDEAKTKFSLRSHVLFPKVSFLNPELTFTVPLDYTAYGAFDAFSHVFEVFVSREYKAPCITTDFMIALMKNIIETSRKVLKDPTNYELRANLMWCSSLALCGITKVGIGKYKFLIHAIEHTISGMYDIPHGLGLGILTLAWMKLNKGNPVLYEFFEKVFDVTLKGPQKVETGIQLFEEWLKELRFLLTLSELKVPFEDLEYLTEKAYHILSVWKADKEVSFDEVRRILLVAYSGKEL